MFDCFFYPYSRPRLKSYRLWRQTFGMQMGQFVVAGKYRGLARCPKLRAIFHRKLCFVYQKDENPSSKRGFLGLCRYFLCQVVYDTLKIKSTLVCIFKLRYSIQKHFPDPFLEHLNLPQPSFELKINRKVSGKSNEI